MGAIRLALWVLVTAFTAGPVAARPRDAAATLRARPSTQTQPSLKAGESELSNRSITYRPATLPAGPRPLLVILHGHGQSPSDFIRMFERWADRCGAILVAPVAEKITWDMIATSQELEVRTTRPSRSPMRFGEDARRIDQDLLILFRLAPIDPKRVAILGFSDGASYSLSLGLANPNLFPWVLSFSPGFALWPERVSRKQKVFIAHGTRDSRLDFANTREAIVQPLRDAGVEVQFRTFTGDHVLVAPILRESLQLAFGCGLQPSH